MQQRIFTSEKLEPLFIFTLLLRTNKLVNQLNSLFHRKSSTVWFWRLLWTNRAESRHAQISSEDSALSQDYTRTVRPRSEPANQTCRRCSRRVTLQCAGGRNRTFCEDFGTTSGAFVIDKQTNGKKGVRVRAPQHSQSTRSGTCCSCERAPIRRWGAKNEKCFCCCFTISVITPHRTHTRT